MILVMVYKDARIALTQNVLDIASNADEDKLLVRYESGDMVTEKITELNYWAVKTDMGATVLEISLKDEDTP
tara:strand:- start:236 stop:451 length:216 start_codon:yes stop_codon:yes gene_type:complete